MSWIPPDDHVSSVDAYVRELENEPEPEPEPEPVDVPARFRAAAEVAEKMGSAGAAFDLRTFATRAAWAPPDVVEAMWRALMGEEQDR
jgi:hypothetical protein